MTEVLATPLALEVNEQAVLKMAHLALEARKNGQGLFAHPITPPELPFIERVKTFGEVNGQLEFPLHALFFLTTTLFADDTTRQLRSIVNRIDSSIRTGTNYAWLFNPSIVAGLNPEVVYQAAKDLIRPGYNARALHFWQHNAQVIINRFGGNLNNFFQEHENQAPAILEQLIGPQSKANWPLFHRFGPKLGRLFLQWVDKYELAYLECLNQIGMPVDRQVARLTIQSGGLALKEPTHKRLVLDQTLVPFYNQFCQQEGISPQELQDTLWLIGSLGCNKLRHVDCPLAPVCQSLISFKPLDKRGLFDPKDTGRFKGKL